MEYEETTDSYKFYDPAGRVLQTKSEDTTQNGTPYQIVQDTEYDFLGRTTRKSLPYRLDMSAGGGNAPTPPNVRIIKGSKSVF